MTAVELEPAVVQVLAVEHTVAEQQVLADKPVVQVVLHRQVAQEFAVQVVEPVAQVAGKPAVELARMLAEVGKNLQP